MKSQEKVIPFLVLFVCILLALGSGVPPLHAGGKGKGKDAKSGKYKGKSESMSEKWMPPGLSKKEKAEWAGGTPPGWSKGKKTGWGERDVPPGFSLWEKAKQEEWQEDLEEAKNEAGNWIRKRSRKQKWGKDREDAEVESVTVSVDETAKAGVPVHQILGMVKKSINREYDGMDIERITRAVAYAAARGANAEEVVKYAEKTLESGINREEVALSIYRWFDQRLEKELKSNQ